MPDVYLDSSAIIKRYVEEPGTPAIDVIFERAANGALVIATSVWNIGEAFGVFDYRRQKRLLTEKEFQLILQNLIGETHGLVRNRNMQVYPIRTSVLTEAWALVLSEHLYEADALQVATCEESKSKVLVTSDERLRRASENVGLRALDPDKQEHDIRDLFG